MENFSPGAPKPPAGMGNAGGLNDAPMDDGTERTAATDAAAKKEAIKAAAEAAAREEEMRRRAEAEVEARRQAAKEAEKKKEGTKEQMGALQVRGSLTAANEIWQMLSGGNGAPKWRRVMHHDTTGEQSHRTEWTNFLVTKPVQEALAAAAGFGWKVHKTAQYRINRQGGDTWVQHPWSFRQDAPAAARPPLPPRGAPAPPHPGTTAWGRRENAWGAAHQQNEAWLRQAAKSKSEVEEVKEVLEAFKKEMQEFVKQELSGRPRLRRLRLQRREPEGRASGLSRCEFRSWSRRWGSSRHRRQSCSRSTSSASQRKRGWKRRQRTRTS